MANEDPKWMKCDEDRIRIATTRGCVGNAHGAIPDTTRITQIMNKQVLIQEATLLLEELPEETSWDDVMYKIYVRQKIEKGLADCERGNVLTTEQVKQHFAQKV
jgi:hypothetical protein